MACVGQGGDVIELAEHGLEGGSFCPRNLTIGDVNKLFHNRHTGSRGKPPGMELMYRLRAKGRVLLHCLRPSTVGLRNPILHPRELLGVFGVMQGFIGRNQGELPINGVRKARKVRRLRGEPDHALDSLGVDRYKAKIKKDWAVLRGVRASINPSL